MKIRKKLIEVALPLEAINKASAHEKMPGIGPHPRGIHLWWARRPLAAARAVIFSQMVDDPSEYVDTLMMDEKLRRKAVKEHKDRHKIWEEAVAVKSRADSAGVEAPDPGPEPTLEEIIAEQERARLFKIIEELVLWENTTNETVLNKARAEIWNSWRRTCAANADHPQADELFNRDKLPAFHDPFAGGGALPLEAQRLGLESYASDLNPVAVLINKAMIEIPPKFAGRPPVNPEAQRQKEQMDTQWKGAQGLADDVRYYGKWMRDEAEKRIRHLYPDVEVTAEMAAERPDLQGYVGQKLKVIAWLWARTVKSPNPAFAHIDVPLASTFMLSTKAGKEAYVEPVIDKNGYRFTVKAGKPVDFERAKNGTKLARGANFRCLMSDSPIASEHIYGEANAGRMGARMMAIVAEGNKGRVYLSPVDSHESVIKNAKPDWKPEVPMPANPRWFSPPLYGLKTYGDLFTNRQLVALTTFSDLVSEAMKEIRRDAIAAGMADDSIPLKDGGTGATAYAEAVAVYLAFNISRVSDFGNSLCGWSSSNEKVMHLFGKQSLPMVWDFAEANALAEVVGGFIPGVEFISKCILKLPEDKSGHANQLDAMTNRLSYEKVISTDPPYYDNIGYADLSDFFYVWLRRSVRPMFPSLFGTLTVPKAEELVATPYRHGGRESAELFFIDGMTAAMRQITEQLHPDFPVTIYYAFKQSEKRLEAGATNTGWDTFLAALIKAGFQITGTWPNRSEQEYRMVSMGTNALASSIVLVCRKRAADAPTVNRRDFISALKAELPTALRHLQEGNIAPVDLAQAAIGPGMAVYTRFSKVLDASGKPVPVREALALINQTLDETLAEQEGDFDVDTRWALAWFDQHLFEEGDFGSADVLARAKVTSVAGVVEAGFAVSSRGKVRLLKPSELPTEWTPESDKRLTIWDMVHHLIRVLETDGESAAARIVAKLGAKAETARELCYRLYTVCERKKRAAEAMSYNGLVQSWPELVRLAATEEVVPTQPELFG